MSEQAVRDSVGALRDVLQEYKASARLVRPYESARATSIAPPGAKAGSISALTANERARATPCLGRTAKTPIGISPVIDISLGSGQQLESVRQATPS